MTNPSISTVIPTYNRSSMLKKTVMSVLHQTYENIKILIVDDCSSDDTSRIVDELMQIDKRIHYYKNNKNLGALENWKKAVSLIDTKYFSLLADDDLLAPDFYKEGINFLENNKTIDFVIFQSLCINNSGNLTEMASYPHNSFKSYKSLDSLKAFKSGKISDKWIGMIFNAECKEIYASIDPQNIDFGHDIRFLLRIFAAKNCSVTSKVGGYYRFHDGNISNNIKQYSPMDELARATRYLEIYHDINVGEDVKLYAQEQIKNLELFSRRKKVFLAFAVKEYINKSIYGISSNFHDSVSDIFVHSHITSKLLNWLFRNKLLKKITKLLLKKQIDRIKLKNKIRIQETEALVSDDLENLKKVL
jgi:glycosyltransferase involved in cell wall biosynthesis